MHPARSSRLFALLASLLSVCVGSAPGRALASPLEEAAQAFDAGDLARALAHLAGKDGGAEARLLEARVHLGLGRPVEARARLEGLVEKLPHLRDLVRFLEGEALFGMGKPLEAATAYRSAARAKGSHFVDLSWRRRADALAAAGRHAEAALEYQQILRVQKDLPERQDVLLALARSLSSLKKKRRDAAERLQAIWLQWPQTTAAVLAKQRQDELAAEGIRLKPAPFSARLERARTLRAAKLFDLAVPELEALLEEARRTKDSEARSTVEHELAYTLVKAHKLATAVPLLEQMLRRSKTPGTRLKLLTAGALGQAGKVDEGLAVLLGEDTRKSKHLTAKGRAELEQARAYLAEHGRYAEAMGLADRLVAEALSKSGRSPKARARLAAELASRHLWLSYRAGRFDLAAEGFARLARRAPGDKDHALYWEARAHGRAGRFDRAEALYWELVEHHLSTYYGLLARSRLVEAGKLSLVTGSCALLALPSASGTPWRREVSEKLSVLVTRWGELYPSLLRAQTLWNLGMTKDARRELRLIAIDHAWVQARLRPKNWIQRPSVERLWQGGPVPRRTWGKREREILKEGAALREALASLLGKAGISYFAWSFSSSEKDPARKAYPRAYQDLVALVSKEHGVDPNLVWAVMRTESSYRLDVISRVGAVGLMQIMPATARLLAREMKLSTFERDELFDPEVNLRMAGWYLGALKKKFRGQIPLMAAAYNGGPHNVARWLGARGRAAEMDEFVEEIPFTESRRYAKKVLRLVALYERVHCGKDDRVAPNLLDPTFDEHPSF